MVGNLDELGAYAYSGHSVLMGEQERDFQDRDYILGLFGQRERDAKKKYLLFVSKGIEEGKKPELTGGGLIRSVGGWKRLNDLRESGRRVNSDKRIPGGSEFVERVLMQANEEWKRNLRYDNNPRIVLKSDEKWGYFSRSCDGLWGPSGHNVSRSRPLNRRRTTIDIRSVSSKAAYRGFPYKTWRKDKNY